MRTFNEFLNESRESDKDLRDLHFETDIEKAKLRKIQIGKKHFGAASNVTAIKDAEYALNQFRKGIEYFDGDNTGVFDPTSTVALQSKLGNGIPVKPPKPPKPFSWNKKTYTRWIKDMAAHGGSDNAYDMAQNAKYEDGLIDYVSRKLVYDETPLERIQWDIEMN